MKKNIIKLLIGTITSKELIVLRAWLKDPENQVTLESYVRDYHDLNLAVLENNLEDAYSRVSKHIGTDKKPIKRLFPNWIKYAAAIVVLMGLTILYHQNLLFHQDRIGLAPKEESITLELDNGVIQNVDLNGVLELRDSNGNIIGAQEQNKITYSKVSEKEELVFNTMNIPRGKKFQLELSDGTLVYLNASSSIKYPVNFLTDGPRQVFLTGEAYFDIARNESNPFIVSVDEVEVKVLGTEFNISAYSEDGVIDVVLVEGSVGMNKREHLSGESVELSPGQRGTYQYNTRSIEVDEVNSRLYTAWMHGHLVFRDMTFDNILAKLERHYNVEIENNNTKLGKEVFNASFENVDIEEILSFFNETHEINYEIKNNKISIK